MNKMPSIKELISKLKDYFSLFVVFIIFIVVFIVSSGYYYYQAGVTETKNIIDNMTNNLVEQCLRMDSYIEDTFTKSYLLSSSTALIDDLRTLQVEENTLTTINVVTTLKDYKISVFNHIDKVFLYNPNYRLYYNDGVMEKDLFFQELHQQQNFTIEEWDTLAYELDKMHILAPITVHDKYASTEKVLLSLVSPIDALEGDWLLVTQINADSILNQFNESKVYERQEFLCLDINGNIVFNSLEQNVHNDLNLPTVDKSTTIIDEFYTIGTKTYLLVGKMTNDNLSYYSLMPQDSLSDIVYEVTEPSLIFLIISFLIFFVIMIIYLRQIYKPIKSIVELSKQVERNGSNEYFKLSKIEMIGNTYRNKEIAIESICEHFIKQIVVNGNRVEFEGFQDIFFTTCNLTGHNLRCVTLRITFTEQYYENFDENEQSYVDKGLSLLLKNMFLTGSKSYVFCVDNKIVCYYNLVENEERVLQSIIKKIETLLSIDSELCKINITRSGLCNASNCVFDATTQALTTLEYCETDNTQLIDFNPSMVSFANIFTLRRRNKLLYLLQTGNKEEIASFVIELDDEARLLKLYYPIYKQMYRQLVDVGREHFYSDKNIEKADQMWQEILDKQKIFEKLNCHVSVRAKLCNLLQLCSIENVDQKHIENVDVIIGYIKEHLNEELYLDKIAKALELTPRYVASIIKEKTSFTISDYISRTRISKAKELIWETDENVTTIGEMVGFDNRITFFRTFKKYEGVSPTNYRKSKTK